MWIILFLLLICVVLLVILSAKDEKNTSLIAENGILKGKMEAMQENVLQAADTNRIPDPAIHEALSVEGIEAAVRYMGYVPERNKYWLRFMVTGEPYYIDIERLPLVFIIRQFSLDTNEWEMDLLKHAAHLMSDDLIMVKATFDEDEQGTGLRFFVAAMDANNASFEQNLPRYLSLIEGGRRRMNEFYEQLVKEKRDAALTAVPFLPLESQENKVLS